jgi:hypothetical protein
LLTFIALHTNGNTHRYLHGNNYGFFVTTVDSMDTVKYSLRSGTILFAILLVSFIQHARAETLETAPGDSSRNVRIIFSQSGFQIGLPFIYEQLPEGKYVPLLLQGNLDFQLKKKSSNPEKTHRFYLYFEPSANPVMIPDTSSSIELGVMAGIKYGIYFKKRDAIKFHLSSGGQYQHLSSIAQASGFIFSNNIGIAYQRNLKRKPLYITAGYRYRYLSNFGISSPNKGIDNHFITFGIGRLRAGN